MSTNDKNDSNEQEANGGAELTQTRTELANTGRYRTSVGAECMDPAISRPAVWLTTPPTRTRRTIDVPQPISRPLGVLLRALAVAAIVGLTFERLVDAQSQLDPTLAISTVYTHTAWRIEDGAFGGVPNAIAQTTDGYLWIGTDAGIVRFDGVRFVNWTPPVETLVPVAPVYALKGTRDGSLWIGTNRGVARWDRDQLQTFAERAGRFNSFSEGEDGTVWAVRSRIGGTALGALCHFGPSSGVRCSGQSDGIVCQNANAVVADSSGSLWFGGSNALCRRSLIETQTSTYLERELNVTGGLPGVTSLASASDGSVLVGIADPTLASGSCGSPSEVRRITSFLVSTAVGLTLWHCWRTPITLCGSAPGRTASIEYVATRPSISAAPTDSRATRFWRSIRIAKAVCGSPPRAGWIDFRGFKVVSFSTRQGLKDDSVHSVVAARDGVIWLGTQGGLERLKNGVVTMLSTAAGLPRKNTTSLFEDRAGRLWVGFNDGLALYDRGRFQSVQSGDNRPLGIVTAMTQDADGTMWVQVKGSRRGLLHITGLHVRQQFDTAAIPTASDVAADPRGGIWLALETGVLGRFRNGMLETFPLFANKTPTPRTLGIDPNGSVWVATSEGLFRWNDTVVTRLNRANGLPCDDLFAVLADGIGGLWLYARCGVIRLSAPDIDKWSVQSDAIVTPVVFDSRDGAVPAATTFRPAASRSLDGRAWFSNDFVAQMVNPDRPPNLMLPNVHVEQLTADRRAYTMEAMFACPRSRAMSNWTTQRRVWRYPTRSGSGIDSTGMTPIGRMLELGGRRSITTWDRARTTFGLSPPTRTVFGTMRAHRCTLRSCPRISRRCGFARRASRYSQSSSGPATSPPATRQRRHRRSHGSAAR